MANRDRILHQVQRWEDLLDLGDPLQEFPPEVTAEDPLKIFIAREALDATLEGSIAAIHANRAKLDTTPELKAETAGLLRQREGFLEWVRRSPKAEIYVVLYPVSEFELVEEEGDGPASDDPGGPDREGGNDGSVTGSG
jgi:hypothetical protein